MKPLTFLLPALVFAACSAESAPRFTPAESYAMEAENIAHLEREVADGDTTAAVQLALLLYALDLDGDAALARLVPLADGGSAEAAEMLSVLYHQDGPIERDEAESKRWMRVALDLGSQHGANMSAQYEP